jgi:hypothetical protein
MYVGGQKQQRIIDSAVCPILLTFNQDNRKLIKFEIGVHGSGIQTTFLPIIAPKHFLLVHDELHKLQLIGLSLG